MHHISFRTLRNLRKKLVFDPVLGLDFPSSRFYESNKNKDKNKCSYKTNRMIFNYSKHFDPILGLDFPSSRFYY